MGLITISFAIWGIGDIFRGFGRSTFAKIGGTEISIEVFRDLYREQLSQLSRRLNRQLTLDQAHAMGLDRQIIRQLVSDFVIDERIRQLGLALSDAEVSRRIMADPAFQGRDGQFDRARFEFLLRQAGFNEQRFVGQQRRDMLRRQLTGTVIGPPMAPNAAIEAANRYQNEQRSVEYVLFDRAQAGDVPDPAPEVLAAYFDENKAFFRAPEFRKVVIVSLIPSEQAQWVEISDEDVKKAYEERKASYSTPERRQIEQMVFPNAEEARAAADRIAKGESFDAIAKERGLSDKDIDLGTVTKASIIDRTVADAAFSLKEGEVSAPVQGRFGTVLVHVVKVEPEDVPPFEKVAGQVRKDLATERTKAQLNDVYNKIEDERSIGKTLAEAAEGIKIPARTVEIDRAGRDTSGAPVANLPDASRLVASTFSSEIGIQTDPLQAEGGYIWYEVTGITPARDRTLDEVKPQVEARWREGEIEKRLKAKAAQFMDKTKAGSSFADAAAADGLKVETKTGIKRGGSSTPFSAHAVDVLFRIPKDSVATGEAETTAEQVVFRVTEIVVPTLDLASEEGKKLRESLNSSFANDIFEQYIAQVQEEIGVTINPVGLRQVVTGSNAPDDNY
jgi:peptidyl-prolyl cis-trans isomerase D